MRKKRFFLDSNFNKAIMDKISFFLHEIALNFSYSQTS